MPCHTTPHPLAPQIMDMHRDEDVTAGELYNRAMISKQDLQAEHAGGWVGGVRWRGVERDGGAGRAAALCEGV